MIRLSEKTKKKMRFGTIYMIVSAIFLSSCVLIYGGRFIYYYNVSRGKIVRSTNNLNELLTQTTKIVLKGDGLQVDGNGYVYRGNPTDNYVKYSGMLWRIMSIDDAGNIKMITDETIADLVWDGKDNTYETSNIRKYLNPIEGDETSGYFYSMLEDPQTYLVPTTQCVTKTKEAGEITACDVHVDGDYVGLMTTSDYWMADGVDSYLNIHTHQWTATGVEGDGVTQVYYVFPEGAISQNSESSTDKYSFGIRPVVTLKANLTITAGNGLKDNPYCITDEVLDPEKTYALNEMASGTYFTYSGYTWRIIQAVDGKTKAIMTDVIRNEDGTVYTRKYSSTSAKFSLNKGNIGAYLNTTFYNTLEHPEYLTEGTFYTGSYTMGGGYTLAKLRSATVEARIGLPQIGELFSSNTLPTDEYSGEIAYWTLNYKKNSELLTWVARGQDWLFGDFATNKNAVRPVIYLNEKVMLSGAGDGSIDFPYEIMMEGNEE